MCLIAFLPKSYAFQSLQNGEISVDGVLFTEIETAATAIKDGSKVFIGPGVYRQGMDITANNVVISGSFDRPHLFVRLGLRAGGVGAKAPRPRHVWAR